MPCYRKSGVRPAGFSITPRFAHAARGLDRKSTNLARDVLQLLRAEIGERDAEIVVNLLANGSGDAYAVGRRERFEARGDVDAIPRNVVAVHDDVADVDADPQGSSVPRSASRATRSR